MGNGDWTEISSHSGITPGGIAARAQLGHAQRGPNKLRRTGLMIMLGAVGLMFGLMGLVILISIITS